MKEKLKKYCTNNGLQMMGEPFCALDRAEVACLDVKNESVVAICYLNKKKEIAYKVSNNIKKWNSLYRNCKS